MGDYKINYINPFRFEINYICAFHFVGIEMVQRDFFVFVFVFYCIIFECKYISGRRIKGKSK